MIENVPNFVIPEKYRNAIKINQIHVICPHLRNDFYEWYPVKVVPYTIMNFRYYINIDKNSPNFGKFLLWIDKGPINNKLKPEFQFVCEEELNQNLMPIPRKITLQRNENSIQSKL